MLLQYSVNDMKSELNRSNTVPSVYPLLQTWRISQTDMATAGAPRLRQPYHAPNNAPVVAYHRGHIVRKPAPATRSMDQKDCQNERKWDRGRGLDLAQRWEQHVGSALLGAPQLANAASQGWPVLLQWRSALERAAAPLRAHGCGMDTILVQGAGPEAVWRLLPCAPKTAGPVAPLTRTLTRLEMPAVFDNRLCVWEVRHRAAASHAQGRSLK